MFYSQLEVVLKQSVFRWFLACKLTLSVVIEYFVLCVTRTGLRDKHIEWDFKIPKIEIISDYEVNGQVLILPITGKGKANVTLSQFAFLIY